MKTKKESALEQAQRMSDKEDRRLNMKTKTQTIPCPRCGLPVPMPKSWDGKDRSEALCNECVRTIEDKPNAQNTPTPWKVCPNESVIRKEGAPLEQYHVAQTFGPDAKANAAYIVRAVNAYEKDQEIKRALVTALKMALNSLTWAEMTIKDIPENSHFKNVISDVKQAIAKSEGK